MLGTDTKWQTVLKRSFFAFQDHVAIYNDNWSEGLHVTCQLEYLLRGLPITTMAEIM
jgi:hypothetical protein